MGKRPVEDPQPSSKRLNTGDAGAGPSSSSAGRSASRSGGSNNDDQGEKKRRDRYAIIRTVPDTFTTKEGSTGEVIKLKANYFELMKRPAYELLMYRVDFEPECESAPKRKFLMYTQRTLLGGYLYDTQNSIYLTHRLPQDVMTFESKDKESVTYKITIKFGTIVPPDSREHLQVLNLILRRSMEGLRLQLFGRNLFDPLGKVCKCFLL